jgi:hypothetical protein
MATPAITEFATRVDEFARRPTRDTLGTVVRAIRLAWSDLFDLALIGTDAAANCRSDFRNATALALATTERDPVLSASAESLRNRLRWYMHLVTRLSTGGLPAVNETLDRGMDVYASGHSLQRVLDNIEDAHEPTSHPAR